MKFAAKPIIVDAFKIEHVDAPGNDGSRLIRHEGGKAVAAAEMTSRMVPVTGDYWVVQEDGYSYLNPKDVFERKYRPVHCGAGIINGDLCGGAQRMAEESGPTPGDNGGTGQ